MSLFLLAIVGLLLLLSLRAMHHSVAIRREWEWILSPWSESMLQGLEIKAASEHAALRSAYRRALLARAAGSRDDALRLLDVGLRIMERSAPDWLEVLASISVLSRMADAVTPIRPLRPWTYRLFPVAWLALVGMILHHLTITTGERLRLRAHILRGCWRIIRHSMRRSTERLRRSDHDGAWDRLDAARSDLANISEETLSAFHAALMSLEARHAAVLPQAARR
jgi:hypothetical protein